MFWWVSYVSLILVSDSSVNSTIARYPQDKISNNANVGVVHLFPNQFWEYPFCFMSRLKLSHWISSSYYYFVILQWMVGFLAFSCSAGAVVGGAIYAKKLFKKKSNTAPRFQQLSSVQTQDILDGDENEWFNDPQLMIPHTFDLCIYIFLGGLFQGLISCINF